MSDETKGETVETGTGGTATLPPPGTALIEVNDIGKSYGSVIALREVTTTVNAGEEMRLAAHRTVCARLRTNMLRITARKRIAPWNV